MFNSGEWKLNIERMASAGNGIFEDSLMECSICFENMVGEIIICPTGHSICKGCFDNLRPCFCPFCNKFMFYRRNLALEKLFKKVGHGQLKNSLNDSVTLCSKCSQPMDTQIGVCRGGHSLCKDCTKKNESCQICLTEIITQRNFLLESCIKKMKTERVVELVPAQIFGKSIGLKNDRTIICPIPNCSFKDVCLSNHFLGEHKQHTVTLKPNCMFRIAVKNFSEKNTLFRVLESSSECFIIVKVKVSHTFMKISAEQITKGSKHFLFIERHGYHGIGMYRFKYAKNGDSKNIILKAETLQLSKLGEYVVRISFSEKPRQ